jgi:hypothetical protein
MDVQFIYLSCNDCGKAFRAPYYECSAGCRHTDYENTRETFAVCAACYLTTKHAPQHLRKRKLHSAFSAKVAKELCQCPGVEDPLHTVIDFEDPESWEDLLDERRLTTAKEQEDIGRACQGLSISGNGSEAQRCR